MDQIVVITSKPFESQCLDAALQDIDQIRSRAVHVDAACGGKDFIKIVEASSVVAQFVDTAASHNTDSASRAQPLVDELHQVIHLERPVVETVPRH